MEINFHSNGNVSQQYSVLLSYVLNGEELLFFESWIDTNVKERTNIFKQ